MHLWCCCAFNKIYGGNVFFPTVTFFSGSLMLCFTKAIKTAVFICHSIHVIEFSLFLFS